MYIAHDNFLDRNVEANNLTKNDQDKLRYTCPHCHAYLELVIPNSSYFSPYFRHKNGNNDKDCLHYNNFYQINSRSGKYYLPDSENNKKSYIFFNSKKIISNLDHSFIMTKSKSSTTIIL